MNIFLRVFLAIYAFCMTILSMITMVSTFDNEILYEIHGYITQEVFEDPTAKFIMFTIGFIFFTLSITFLFSGFKSDKDKKAVSKYTNIGEIKISLNTMENIALGASRRLNGVRDTKAQVIRQAEGVAIVIKAVVMSDINIPALSEDIQIRVKNAVEDSCGIKVDHVRVVIENIYTNYKARVE